MIDRLGRLDLVRCPGVYGRSARRRLPAFADPPQRRLGRTWTPPVNLGRTCAEDLLALKFEDLCETALSFLL